MKATLIVTWLVLAVFLLTDSSTTVNADLNLSSAQMAVKVDGLQPFKHGQTGETKCPNLADGTQQVWCCNSNGTDCKCATTCGSWPW